MDAAGFELIPAIDLLGGRCVRLENDEPGRLSQMLQGLPILVETSLTCVNALRCNGQGSVIFASAAKKQYDR